VRAGGPGPRLAHPLTRRPALSVMDTMTQQRETLLRATDKASNTNSLTQRARGLMRMMIVRSRTNVALLVITIVALLASIGAVVCTFRALAELGLAFFCLYPLSLRPPQTSTTSKNSQLII
jgi:hypothetical protein